jgi:phospholipase C
VNAVANGPNWSSTAIFITYDDCGCFYDHVAPPPGLSLGIRVPMVIVSPYAKAGFTDSSTASFASMLAFIEHTWQIPALNSVDGTAYDYRNSFNYLQIPLAPARLTPHRVPAWELAHIRAHPFDEDDPT